jgi:hypothetical protein
MKKPQAQPKRRPPRYLCGHQFKHDCHGAPPSTAVIEASACPNCQVINILHFTGGLVRGVIDADGQFQLWSDRTLGTAVSDPAVRLVQRQGNACALCFPKRYAYALALRESENTFTVLYDPRGGNTNVRHTEPEDSPGSHKPAQR